MAVVQVNTGAATQELMGLSTDAKPTTNVKAGAIFTESDGGKQFKFSGTAWFPLVIQTSITGSLANEPFTQADLVDGVFTFSETQNSLYLHNKGLADMTFTVNSETFTLEPSQYFDERLLPFTVIAIASTGAVACYGYGRV